MKDAGSITGGARRSGGLYGYIKALRDMLDREGLAATCKRVLHKALGRYVWIERVAFYDSDLARPPALLSPLAPQITFHIATPHQLLHRHRATLETNFHLSNRKVKSRLAHSHVALLALFEHEPIAMIWLSFSSQKVGEVGATLSVHTAEVLTYDEFTLPAWRGLGIILHLNQFANSYVRHHGVTRRINWRLLGNKPALQVAAKLGDRLLASVTTVRLFGKPKSLVFGLNSASLRPLLQGDSWEHATVAR